MGGNKKCERQNLDKENNNNMITDAKSEIKINK